jgi:hypothetical protein
MKTVFTPCIAFLWFFLSSAAQVVASEEEFVPNQKVTIGSEGRKITITGDGGKTFGEVRAILETTKDTNRIESIRLTVAGKEFVVPKEQFSDLRDPLVQTAQFRWEAGRDSGPWLYLTFQLATPDAKSPSDRPRVYICYQNGKLMERTIRQPQQ